MGPGESREIADPARELLGWTHKDGTKQYCLNRDGTICRHERAKQMSSHAQTSAEDNERGMSPEEQWDKFWRVQSNKGNAPG